MPIEVKIETVDYSNYHFFRFASIKIGSGPYMPVFPTINSKVRFHKEMIHDVPVTLHDSLAYSDYDYVPWLIF